jgi:hypothetical protein
MVRLSVAATNRLPVCLFCQRTNFVIGSAFVRIVLLSIILLIIYLSVLISVSFYSQSINRLILRLQRNIEKSVLFTLPCKVAGVCTESGRGLPPPTCQLSENSPLTLHRIKKTDCMIRKMRQEAGQTSRAKVSTAICKVNRAYSQFRDSGILFAPANGKLYFEFLKIFSVPENHLPLQGAKTLPKSAFFNRNF